MCCLYFSKILEKLYVNEFQTANKQNLKINLFSEKNYQLISL